MKYFVCFLLSFAISTCQGQRIDGEWSPWEADAEIDCCMYGGFERVQRYCNNPQPEGNGTKCMDGTQKAADIEERWRTCKCECQPECDGVTAFCANDTGAAAHCACNFGNIIPPGFDPNNVTYCITPPSEAPATEPPKVYPTMSDKTKKIMTIVQTATITWLLICLFAILTIFFVLCNFKTDRVIQMNEEITLAITHILIVFAAEETDPEGLCRFVSVALHYFFMCTMTFFCLEALHAYSLITYVVPTRGYLSTLMNLGIGYGAPILPLAISVGVLWDKYGTNGRHCWCAFDDGQGWGYLTPILFLAFTCTVIAEAQGQGSYKELPDSDNTMFTSARVSQGSIMIIMPLTLASYSLGLVATERQNLYLYSIFSLLNTILGPVIFFFHTIGNAQVRAILAKIFFCFPCFKEKSDRPSSGRVAPADDDHHEGRRDDDDDDDGGKDDDDDDSSAKKSSDQPPPSSGTSGQPPASPKGPDDKDTDWKNFYKWVTDGKKSNINQAENVLFE